MRTFPTQITARQKANRRPRIGLISPASDILIERDFWRMGLAAGADIFTTRIPLEMPLTPVTLARLADGISGATGLLLPDDEIDAVVFGCTSGSAVIGPDNVAKRVHDVNPKLKVTNPATAAVAAMDPVIIGTNKHEGEMFVHGAFPITMSKPVYWMFAGALFRDSASRVLKHYRGFVDQIEKEAEELARKQTEEEEAKHYYEEHHGEMERQYQMLLSMNSSNSEEVKTRGSIASVEKWTNGAEGDRRNKPDEIHWHNQSNFVKREQGRHERRKQRAKQKALKEAAKVVVDYRPVMSRIIDDYLFRCPSWHLAHKLSRNRLQRGHSNNVYVYQFSHSTHIPGYKECWGKSCHTSEIPFVFQAMDIIRTNYSTLGPYAQQEAPKSPEYPYTDILKAYRQAVQAADHMEEEDHTPPIHKRHNHTHSIRFQRILHHFFGDYFSEDVDEETANDMADRWVSFARRGDPNYDESKANWRPWRYVFDEPKRRRGLQTKWWKHEENDFKYIFNLDDVKDEDDSSNATSMDGFQWSDIPAKRVYRRRMLKALGMEVAFEDVFQTILRRIPKTDNEPEHPLHSLLFGSLGRSSTRDGKNQNEQQRTRKALQQLQQIAQEMGIMGTGLHGQYHDDNEDDDFFPQILELKWPPEDRLIERDCTCDMWDRIRCKLFVFVNDLCLSIFVVFNS